MVGTGRYELPTPRTPSGFRTIHAICYGELSITVVNRLNASSPEAGLLPIAAIFDLGSPQKSPQSPQLGTAHYYARLNSPEAFGFLVDSESQSRTQRRTCVGPNELPGVATELPCVSPLATGWQCCTILSVRATVEPNSTSPLLVEAIGSSSTK